MVPFHLPLGFTVNCSKALLSCNLEAQIRVSEADSVGGKNGPRQLPGFKGTGGTWPVEKSSVGRGGLYFTKVVCGISNNQRTGEEWNFFKRIHFCV